MRIIGRLTRRSASPTATATVGATSAGRSTWNFFASNATLLNGSNAFDRRLEALGQHLGEALGPRRAAAQHDRGRSDRTRRSS